MDITLDVDNQKLNIRAGAVIIHNNKLLLHRNVNSDHYVLPGGRVEIGENSEETIKREILEEMGKEVEVIGYVSTIENFFEMRGYKYHEIMFVHKVEFKHENDKNIEETIKNIEGKDFLIYEWVDLNEIDNCSIMPKVIKEILKEKELPVHKINNDFK